MVAETSNTTVLIVSFSYIMFWPLRLFVLSVHTVLNVKSAIDAVCIYRLCEIPLNWHKLIIDAFSNG